MSTDDPTRGWIPEGFLEAQQYIIRIQQKCIGYHAPETKKICGKCFVEVLDLISGLEKRRCVAWLDEHGHPELALALGAAVLRRQG